MKRIVITGATSGIGKETTRELLRQGHTLTMLVRNEEKAKMVHDELGYGSELDYIICDLASLKSTQEVSNELLSQGKPIDVLINNAGGMLPKRLESEDGLELNFAMNHLGHFLLTMRLLETLKSNKARVINLSSEAHRAGKLDFNDLQLEKNFSPFKGYANAKLCNVYFTRELHRRYHSDGLTAYAVHPGIVNSNFGSELKGFFSFVWRMIKPFQRTSEKGAETSIYLSTESGIEDLSGKYFKNKKPTEVARVAQDDIAADKLWNVSLDLVKPYLN